MNIKTRTAIILTFLLLVTLPISFASNCVVNETCTFYRENTNPSASTLQIFFILPNLTQTDFVDMTLLADDIYYYQYNFTETGNILACIEEDGGGSSTYECNRKYVFEHKASEELNVLAELLEPFIIFLVGVLLLVLAYSGESRSTYIFGIAAGIWWLASATVILFTGVVITSIFFMLLGIATVIISIGEIIKVKGDE